jgi:2-keto-3-deoxy-L-rhamnonate aldolase RhmA
MSDIQRFRREIQAGKVLLGAGISFSDPLVTDCLADSVDFFWVDTEHAAMAPETIAGHLLAARARKAPVLVRVVGSGCRFIKPMLDAGAEGIIVPQVSSAEEVREVVGDCRYPPQGCRGYGPRVPTTYGRFEDPGYMRRANRDVYVSVQIENAAALAALDEIVTLPGLDAVVIGPMDLSGSLGLPGQPNHPRVVAAMEKIIRQAHAAGIAVGAGVGPTAASAIAMAKRGVNWMQMGCDAHYLWQHFDSLSAEVHNKLKKPARARTAAQSK